MFPGNKRNQTLTHTGALCNVDIGMKHVAGVSLWGVLDFAGQNHLQLLNNKLLGTSASLLVTSALLVVTRS